jgi:hypothetical protein
MSNNSRQMISTGNFLNNRTLIYQPLHMLLVPLLLRMLLVPLLLHTLLVPLLLRMLLVLLLVYQMLHMLFRMLQMELPQSSLSIQINLQVP